MASTKMSTSGSVEHIEIYKAPKKEDKNFDNY